MSGGHHPEPSVGELLLPVVNFLIFLWVLRRFLVGPIVEFFRMRAERLREAIAAGNRARAEAEALKAQLARDRANLPAIREQLRADLRSAAERQRDLLIAAGRQAADRIRTDARLVAEQELQSAREALRAELVDEAVRQAVALVRSALSAGDQERFVQEFISGAGASR
jgi:F-type H+-transporting ATPase subunit b